MEVFNLRETIDDSTDLLELNSVKRSILKQLVIYEEQFDESMKAGNGRVATNIFIRLKYYSKVFYLVVANYLTIFDLLVYFADIGGSK
jgi:hypothetical protein